MLVSQTTRKNKLPTNFLKHLHAANPFKVEAPNSCNDQCPVRFLGIIGQDPCVSKSKLWHVVIFQFFFFNIKYVM